MIATTYSIIPISLRNKLIFFQPKGDIVPMKPESDNIAFSELNNKFGILKL